MLTFFRSNNRTCATLFQGKTGIVLPFFIFLCKGRHITPLYVKKLISKPGIRILQKFFNVSL